MAVRNNVTEYFGHICCRLNFKRTLFTYQITVTTVTTMSCSSQQYCSTQQKLIKLRKVSTIGCSIRRATKWGAGGTITRGPWTLGGPRGGPWASEGPIQMRL